MSKKVIADGAVHNVPEDLYKVLISNPSALKNWENLTPLARNEWICWSISTKKAETRKNHIERTITHLLEGKCRPCCWAGCTHR